MLVIYWCHDPDWSEVYWGGCDGGQLSWIGQALPSVNHNDLIHRNSNHAHLHLITTIITVSIRAHATVHSPSDLVYTTWTLLLLQSKSWVSTLPYLPVDPYLLCLLLVFSSPARLSVSVVSVLLSISPSHLPVICGQEEIDSYSSIQHQNDLEKSFTHLKSPLHIPV